MHELAQLQLEGSGVAPTCEGSVQLMRKVLEFTDLKNRTVDAYHGTSSV